jgi:enoyl-CoA hydratase/carnithine racemase
MTEQDILVEHRGAIGLITLNRPARRNAIRYDGWRAIAAAVGGLGAEAEVRAIVLLGAGEEAFSAGADITEFPTFRSDRESGARYHEAVAGTLAAIEACPTPVIAMIHGYCIGGGCELAVACDLRLSDEAARFAIPSAKRGIILGVAELRALRELVGLGTAKEMLLTGRTLDASEALRIGLVNQVVPRNELWDVTLGVAEQIAGNVPLAVTATKNFLGRIARNEPEEEIAAAQEEFAAQAYAGREYHEQVKAFIERR